MSNKSLSPLIIKRASLPDINSLEDVYEHGFLQYGRFAVLEDGSIWFGDALSSHPQNTDRGWYWAISNSGELLVSARGTEEDGVRLFTDNKPLLGLLVEELIEKGLIRKPLSFEFKP